MFHCVKFGAIDADLRRTKPVVDGVGTTPVFFRLMVRPKFLAASEKRLTM